MLVLLFPLYWMVKASVSTTADIVDPGVRLLPSFGSLTLDGFKEVFERQPAAQWLLNSFMIALGSTAIATVVSIFAGYALSRFTGAPHRFLGLTLLVSRMLPGSLLVIPFYSMFLGVGLINSLGSLMVVNTVFIAPFTAWMMKSFFDGIPVELEEAAMVDGCGQFRTLITIILPLSKPGLAAIITYSVILAWGDFLFARTLITSADKWPSTVGVASFVGDYTVNWNALMAMALLSVLPMAILFIFTERYLVAGLAAGAVKG
jgi:multiple sugar transport system permease protein